MWFCPECEHFKPDKIKKEGDFMRYGCNKRGYIPQPVKEFKHIACGCGEFEEKQQTQLSLFGKEREFMTPEYALEIMCRRCENREMCQGTGCEPKKVLKELIEHQKEGGQE